jgi:UDP-N-acetylmuramoyl-tripeptide--D-alanyl-D-alanine ligase
MNPPHNIIYYGTKTFTHYQGKLLDTPLFMSFKWIPSDDVISNESEASEENYIINTHLVGAYNFENAMAAVSVGYNFGISPCNIKAAIEEYVPQNSRSQIFKTEKGNTLLLDNYNANPSSMEAALENFAKIEMPNKILILGDMLELGSASHREHSVILGLIHRLGFKNVYLVGSEFGDMSDAQSLHNFSNTDECAKYLETANITDSTILIKGSHGMHMDKVVPYL